MCVDGVVFAQVEELLQSLIDEDDADESSESLLCEPGDVADQRASVCRHQDKTQESRPQPDARPQRQVRQAVVPGKEGNRHGGEYMLVSDFTCTCTFWLIRLIETVRNLFIKIQNAVSCHSKRA